MGNPFHWIWKEVRGNAIWDATKWAWCAGGATVSALCQTAQSIIKGHPDVSALFVGVLPVLLIFFVFLLTKKMRLISSPAGGALLGRTATIPKSTPPVPTRQSKPSLIRIEILEGITAVKRGALFEKYYAALLVRVSLSEMPETTIKKWELDLTLDGDYYSTGTLINEPFTEMESYVEDKNGPSKTIAPELSSLTSYSPLRINVGTQGWLLFEVNLIGGFEYMCGADFKLTATDELDRKHEITKRPSRWLKSVTARFK